MPVPGNTRFVINANPVIDRMLLLKNALKKQIGMDAMKTALLPMWREAVVRVPVDTGALRKGLLRQARAYAGGLRIVGLVGPSRSTRKLVPGKTWKWAGPMPVSRYAHLVENGAPHHAAQPFLRPAYDHGLLRFPADFARHLMSGIAAVLP